MISVIIPVLILFVIVLFPSIPKIGGNIIVALLAAGFFAAILGGLNPIEILSATISGIDRLAWVIMLSVFGSIYAETQSRLGTVEATLNGLKRLFGGSPLGLVIAVMVTLVFAGSVLGDAIAAATVIGFLVIPALYNELKLKPEHIAVIILLGASLGAIMPPITQGIFLSASLIDVEPTQAVKVGYITVTIGVIIAIIQSAWFIRGKSIEQPLQDTGIIKDKDTPAKISFSKIIKKYGTAFLPLLTLIIIVVANSGFDYNIFEEWAPLLFITESLEDIPIISGLINSIVFAIIIATLVSYLFSRVRKDGISVVKNGLINVRKTALIQICAGIMIGIFYDAGTIDTVQSFVEELNTSAIKGGGGAATMLVGMLTGSQTAAQTTIITFIGPTLLDLGVNPTNVIIGSSHFAMAGQSFPPVGLVAFVVVGIVGGVVDKKVDPVKVMIIALPNAIYFMLIGLGAWFL